ncbi:protein phosphatase CheZ [Solimonas marina]|uniref:Protein phosphatase CheZ n=1 Tax=Solimonas marina TaxID=2714601 RepID=A0A969W8X7_9GAMM|nr:protein phosphatase CheZ [Solimonas marina]
MSASAEDRGALIEALKTWLARLESGGSIDAPPPLAELLQKNEHAFYRQVAELTRRLHTAVVDLRLDERLTRIAGDGMPDARDRLQHVVRMTEQAAHRTLDLVDQLRVDTRAVTRGADALPDDDPTRAMLLHHAETMRERLNQLSMAQEYQDITGQIIKRIITLVDDVEAALLELLGTHASQLKTGATMPIADTKTGLAGPAMPGQITTSQQDADALLASLGV